MKPALTLLTAAAVAWSAIAQAALPPQYQRLREIQAILDDARIMRAFDLLHPIDRIERVEHDLYRVNGGGCSMDISIKDDPSVHHPDGWTGRRAFILDPGPLVCK